MSRNVLQARSAEVQSLSRDFQTLIEHYGRNSFTEEDQLLFMDAFEEALFNITFRLSRVHGCPVGYVECPGGGCAKRNRACREPLFERR